METINNKSLFIEKYGSIKQTLLDSFYSVTTRLNLKGASRDLYKLTDGFIDSHLDYFLNQDENVDTNENLLELRGTIRNNISEDEFYSNLFEFLSLVSICGHCQLLNLDRDRLEAKGFGYTDCFSPLYSFLSINTKSSPLRGVSFSTDIENKLLSFGRNISFEQYLNDEYFLKDIENVTELCDLQADSTMPEDVEEVLKVSFANDVDRILDMIGIRYSYLLEGCVGGIDDYVGVFTGNSIQPVIKVSSSGIKSVTPERDLASAYYPLLTSRFQYQLPTDLGKSSSGRQFDKELIARTFFTQGENAKPIYFPYKILEIISKSRWTKRSQMLVYTSVPESEIGDLKKYTSTIKNNFKPEVYMFLHQIAVSKIVQLEPERLSNNSTLEEREEVLIEVCELRSSSYDALAETCKKALAYYCDCVTTAFVVATLKTNKRKDGNITLESITEFRLKNCGNITDIANLGNAEFVDSVAKSCSLSIDDLPEVSNIRQSRLETSSRKFACVDYAYTFNSSLANALPSFAYKALQKIQSKYEGTEESAIGWDNILLGRDKSSKLVTSGKGKSINIQGNNLHYIISGSRSGKGVMCYNIFATALGTSMPMFYLDRKPDTSIVLKGLAKDMFCFNGGQYDEAIDYTGIFKPSKFNIQIPKYAEGLFNTDESKFDYAYFRAILLYLTMIAYADIVQDEIGKMLQNELGGGSILVLDEFSNFMANFGATALTASQNAGSWFTKANSRAGIDASVKGYCDTNKKAAKNYTKATTAKGKNVPTEQDIADAEKELQSIKKENVINWLEIYIAAIADAYYNFTRQIKTLQDAAGVASKKMHIFIIGQKFDDIKMSLDGEPWFNPSSGKVKKFNKSENCIPLVKGLNLFKSDIIAGYQVDRETYLAQHKREKNEDGTYKDDATKEFYSTGSDLSASQRMFAYKSMGNLTGDDLEKVMNTHKAHKGNRVEVEKYLSSWAFFKPFLILNNAIEPPEEIRYKDRVPVSFDELENIRKGKKEYQGKFYVESQFVGQCLHTAESSGLTWDDLLHDNDDGSGHLDEGIGFEGYVKEMSGSVPSDIMEKSGHLATMFVRDVIGYPGSWEDFLVDFRPEWIISPTHVTSTGLMSVQERLSESFFIPRICDYEVYKDFELELGSLVAYYNINSNSTDINVMSDMSRTSDLDEYKQQPDNNINSQDTPNDIINNNSDILSSVNHGDYVYNQSTPSYSGSDIRQYAQPMYEDEEEEFFDAYDEEVYDKYPDSFLRDQAELIISVVEQVMGVTVPANLKSGIITYIISEYRARGY